MKSEKVISLIKKHRPELAKFGVKSLAVFGSVARGEAGPDSDVDILVEFEGRATFDGFMDTKYYLGLMLVDKKSSSVIMEFLLKETKHTGGRCNDKRLRRFLYLDVRSGR
jgi:predicted nucleotidyltransferase